MDEFKLYKYCKIPAVEYWRDMLAMVKFTKIAHLNDPFEGFLRVKDEAGFVTQEIPRDTYVASFSRVHPFTKEDVSDERIQSNVYMWSHYADSMNGICMQFSLDDEGRSDELAYEKVRYLTRYPEEITAFCKYKSWAFEKEAMT